MSVAKLFLFFIFSLVIFNAAAQTNFLPGYYIINQKDTVRGLIRYASEAQNSKVCVYKKDKSSEAIRLTPKEISGFVIDDRFFYEMRVYKDRQGVRRGLFFKVVVNGKLSLLRSGSVSFARDSAQRIYEITKVQEHARQNSVADIQGIGILKALMNDCPQITSGYIDKQYKQRRNLAPVFLKYNQCVGGLISNNEKSKIKPHVNVGLIVAPAISSLTFGWTFSEASFERHNAFSAGLYASLFIPRVENFRLVLEASYGKEEWYKYFPRDGANNDLFISYSFIKAPLLVRYSSKRFFFDVGVQNQLILSENSTWRAEEFTGDNSVITHDYIGRSLTRYSLGYIFGAGVNYSIAGLPIKTGVRFSKTESHNHAYQPVYKNIELLFAFQLNK